ncbi:helix-turn-helix transcriptional regulator [Celeribacter ethanolicus]|uniref:helix-turn-helix transcriptional regulator n=1 Tax=Celeribacter ethanolicus TaxID=1758178 RepID=UPI00138F5013|nr:response regulator transcription factor [Celeribacter ethanolicus]
MVLRTIENEFQGVEAKLFNDVATWQVVYSNQTPPERQATRLVIVDERQAEEFMSSALSELRVREGIRIAFGVRDMASAMRLAERWVDEIASAEMSLLPMNLNLTAWIQLIRLIDCGANYLPAPIFNCIAHESDVQNNRAEMIKHPHRPQSLSEREASACRMADLTPREREVLSLVAAGRPNKAIANDLSVSAHTIKLHIHRIMTKLGVSNRTEAAICFHNTNARGNSASLREMRRSGD